MSLILVPPPMDSRIGLYITDGTVTWIVDDVRDGTPVGSIRGSLYLPKGYIKANGATVNRADYPRLIKWINDNNLWTDDTSSNLGLFGKGNGSTTFILPNLVGRMVQFSDNVGKTIAAGLPEIEGDSGSLLFLNIEDLNSYGGYLENHDFDRGSFRMHTWSIRNIYPQMITGSAFDGTIYFKASLSNPIYGKSSTVQPPAITYIPIIRY